MSKLMDKLIKGSTVKLTAAINDSTVYGKSEMCDTGIPMLNVALSGMLDGGLSPGILMIAGPSKHFKTGFSLCLAGAYLRKYDDAAMLFYDSEFGAPEGYFNAFGVDMERVVHTPITDVEQLKFDMLAQFKQIEKSDHVITMIDSIGNLASKKEVEDAENEKSVSDMTRAKQMKSLGRIITPYTKLREIPVIAINHTYKEISMYPKDIVSGGTGWYYSSNDVWIIGRQQEKDGKEVTGYNFIINIDKSRYVQERSKIPITVTFEGGIEKWSGLFEVALEGGFINSPKQGWYVLGNQTEKSYRKSDLEYNDSLWSQMIEDDGFKAYIEKRYKLPEMGAPRTIEQTEIEKELEDADIE